MIEEKLPNISINEQFDVYCFLYELCKNHDFEICIGLLEQCRQWNIQSADVTQQFSRFGDSAIGKIARMYQRHMYFNSANQDEMDIAFKQIQDLNMEKVPESMGLLIGYAGEGLLRLSALNQTDLSWMLLL